MICKSASDGKIRKITGIEQLDWCASTRNINSIKNPFVRTIFKEAKSSQPEFYRNCPLYGVSSMVNYNLDKNLMNMIPLGTYILKAKMYDGLNQPKSKQLKIGMNANFSLTSE